VKRELFEILKNNLHEISMRKFKFSQKNLFIHAIFQEANLVTDKYTYLFSFMIFQGAKFKF
jgi:hypothetical protein